MPGPTASFDPIEDVVGREPEEAGVNRAWRIDGSGRVRLTISVQRSLCERGEML